MTPPGETLQPAYFDAIYASDLDPWKFASSAYERNKYAATLAALPRPRYNSAFEVGCSIGVFTRDLASRCDTLLAVDAAAAPLREAARRCAGLSMVRFEHMFAPDEWPDAIFDLIVLSEVVYYLDAKDVSRLAERVSKTIARNGDIILVHWTGKTDYPLTGDEAVELFIAAMGASVLVQRQDRSKAFRLDVLQHR
jgi:cyclopropane fatty-acyl-phospholipid synthase-like methyltransferase